MFLSIPDKRYTFDIARRNTTIIDLLRNYEDNIKKPGFYNILEHLYYHKSVSASDVWNNNYKGKLDVKRFELPKAIGRTGLEAMACGCVPLLSSIGGVYEYAVNNTNSLIVDTKTNAADDIVTVINKLLADDGVIREMKEKAIITSKEFSIEKAAQSEIDLFLSTKYQKQLAIKDKEL